MQLHLQLCRGDGAATTESPYDLIVSSFGEDRDRLIAFNF
jgi:hypothetical protein